MGNNNNESNGYKSLPAPPSPYIGRQLNGEGQDHRDTSDLSSKKRRSELHLPQREHGASTKDVPRAERDSTMNSKSSKSSKTSSSSQSKNAHSADDRGHKNGQVRNNRTSKAPKYDAGKDLAKTCEKVQKQLMQQAYEQGRKEVTASFGKERSRLQSKAQHLMDAVIETYGSGVRSGVFEREVKFDKQLQAVMVHLQSLSRWDACADGGRVGLHDESDSVTHSDTASDNGSE